MFGVLNMFKPTETFIISHSEEIKPATIKEAGELINYVIGVNNDLLDRGKSGWLIVKKISTKKKVDTTIYATRLDMPLLEDDPYFTTLLEPFYQNKPVDFDETVLLGMDETNPKEKNSVAEVSEIPALPKNLESLVQKGTDTLKEEKDNEEEPSIPQKVSEESNSLTEEQAKQYQQEIERLKHELEQKNEIIATKSRQEKEVITSQPVVHVASPTVMTDSKDFPEVVGTALTYQLNQLEQEIRNRDTRPQLKDSIINDFQDRKKKAIENKLIELEAEKNIKLEKPKAEYERLVQQIVDEHNKNKEKEMKSITDYYEKECQLKIASESEKISEDLAEFLNQRKGELLTWQQSFNTDIESQLGSMFYVFQLPAE